MKRILRSSMLLSVILMASGLLTTLYGASETRKLSPFTSIGIAVSADVEYIPGNKYEIIIEGDEKDVKDLITEVENGKLKIKYDDWRTKRSRLTITVTSKELDGVSMSGSGKFVAARKISSEEMNIALSGSGQVIFPDLQAEEVEIKISGSGNTVLENGSSEEMDVKISGSGRLLAEQFAVDEFEVAISGSGSCKITVKEELNSRISGSGSVYYHGNPRISSTSSGSGKLKSL